MTAAVLRLIALLALVLMPIGMASAPAAAHEPMAAEHCADQSQPDQGPAPQTMDCVATCTALPASDTSVPAPLVPTPPRLIALADIFVGIVPEIATPPPKPA